MNKAKARRSARHKKKHEKYRLMGIKESNKIKKIKRHLKTHSTDKVARKALNNL